LSAAAAFVFAVVALTFILRILQFTDASMSTEAQFYEALRRQRVIERRQSMGVERQVQQPKYQSRYIPVGVLREDDMQFPWAYNPLRRTKLASSEQNLSRKELEQRA
jgi:hypothetical protein